MLVDTKDGQHRARPKEGKDGHQTQVAPSRGMPKRKSMSCLRTEVGMKVNPKWFDSHKKRKNKVSLVRRGNGLKAKITHRQEENRVTLAKKKKNGYKVMKAHM